MFAFVFLVIFLGAPEYSEGCISLRPLDLFDRRGFGLLNNFARRLGKAAQDDEEVPMINIPGQRFTATHGIKAKKGEAKLFLFTVEEFPPANYAAISANIAIAGIRGGHQKYGMFLRYGAPPTPAKWDYRSEVTASDSYIGDKLYSQDIRIETPHPGEYYLLIYAYEDYQELLVTAIVDTPPEYDNQVNVGPGFTIQRMGRPN